MSPWCSSLMVADSFFCLKIGRLKATVHRITHRFKNWFSRSGGFCYRILLRLGFSFSDCSHSHNGWGDCWHNAAVTARFAKGLWPICHNPQILTDFTMTRFQTYWPTLVKGLDGTRFIGEFHSTESRLF
jgi:hypothetical protein